LTGHRASILAIIRSAIVIASAMPLKYRRRATVPVCKPSDGDNAGCDQQNSFSSFIHRSMVHFSPLIRHCDLCENKDDADENF
jgi:hypothetical protein